MLRLARDPAGEVRPDPLRQAEGRGAYVCRDCSPDRRGLARAFRAPVTIGQETLDFTREWQRSESTR
jgi:predicted RNA-binding protein YlxR (DUF448 family)